MARNYKPEFAYNPRDREKQKPIYVFGLKVPTPANSSLQCWTVAIFTFVGYHCYITNFPYATHPISNTLGVIFCSLTLYSHFMTWSTSPGTVPDKGWDKEDDSMVNSYNKPFCETCQKYKPERTHHCKTCGICVLKMDHHCPFTDNCVGWGNYKYYISLLIWGNATMIAFMIVTTVHVWKMVFGVAEGEAPVEWSLYLLITFIFIILAEALLSTLLISHALFVLIDKTTIEWRETKHLGNMFSYWGNIGMWYTCTQRALGASPLYWLFPTRRTIAGDGVNFHKPFFRQVPKGSKDDPDAELNRPKPAQSPTPSELVGDKH